MKAENLTTMEIWKYGKQPEKLENLEMKIWKHGSMI